MKTWVALLRGINVGGKNIVPMKELRKLLDDLGFRDVKTYIQSGNCAFRSEEDDATVVCATIAERMSDRFGFRPKVMAVSKDALARAISNNPYSSEGAAEPRSVHFFFLSRPASAPDMDALDRIRKPSESFSLSRDVFYLHAPEGIARSKLAAQVEAKLGVAVTARNQRTVNKIAGMIE